MRINVPAQFFPLTNRSSFMNKIPSIAVAVALAAVFSYSTDMSCGEDIGESTLSSEEVFSSFSEETQAENIRKDALYYPTGELKEIRSYSKETHKSHGKWEEYYKNGQLKSVKYYENGKELGQFKEYYESGKLEGIGNGSKFEEYYESGKLKLRMVGQLKNGEPENGKIEQYYENGKFKRGVNIKNGKFHGQYKECDENGKLWTAGNFIDDKKDGQWREKQLVAINGQRVVATFGTRNGQVVSGRFGSGTYNIDQRAHGNEYGDIILYYKNGQLVR